MCLITSGRLLERAVGAMPTQKQFVMYYNVFNLVIKFKYTSILYIDMSIGCVYLPTSIGPVPRQKIKVAFN